MSKADQEAITQLLRENEQLREQRDAALKELKNLVQIFQPIEQGGKHWASMNIPGFATLNAARAAIALCEGDTQ